MENEYMIDGGKKFATLNEATTAAENLVRRYDESAKCSIWRLVRTVEAMEAPLQVTDYTVPPEERLLIVGPED